MKYKEVLFYGINIVYEFWVLDHKKQTQKKMTIYVYKCADCTLAVGY